MFGLSTKKFTEQMRKGETYRLVFKYWGELTETKQKNITEKLKEKLANDLRITRIAFNEPKFGRLTVEGVAMHDPIPFLLIGGLVCGIAILWGVRLALESVYKVMGVFTPNKIVLLCLLLGIPYLIFSGRLSVKGLKVKGVK